MRAPLLLCISLLLQKKQNEAGCIFPIVYCLLYIVYWLLSIGYCLLSIVYCLLAVVIVCCLLSSPRGF
jgi:hypothetical protein